MYALVLLSIGTFGLERDDVGGNLTSLLLGMKGCLDGRVEFSEVRLVPAKPTGVHEAALYNLIAKNVSEKATQLLI